jgi:hypothetical protein
MIFQGRGALISIAVLTVTLSILLAIAGNAWMKEHDTRLKVESKASEQQRDIQNLQQQREQVQAALSRQLAALEQEKKRPVTAPQFVVDTAKLIPNLPKPLEVRNVPQNPGIPDAPRVQEVVVPAEDLRVIRDAQVTCEEKSLRLATCESQESSLKEQLRITETQRDEWKTAARGGSRWHRTLVTAKWFAIGAGAGYAGYAFSHR